MKIKDIINSKIAIQCETISEQVQVFNHLSSLDDTLTFGQTPLSQMSESDNRLRSDYHTIGRYQPGSSDKSVCHSSDWFEKNGYVIVKFSEVEEFTTSENYQIF